MEAPSHLSSSTVPERTLVVAFLGFGISSVIVQAVLARELLSVLHGSELCLGLVFGAWLLWIGLGAQIGAIAARSGATPWLFALGGLIAAVVPFAQVAAVREARLLLHIPIGEYVPLAKAALLILVVAAPFSAMVGLTFPLGARLYAGSAVSDARPVGRLYAEGVFATRVSSAVNVVGEEIGLHTGSIYHSLRQVFPQVLVTWDTTNYLFATEQRGVLSADPRTLGQRFTRRGVRTEFFSDAHPEILLPEGRSEAIQSALDDPRFRHLNTDREPVSYLYNLLLWDRFS